MKKRLLTLWAALSLLTTVVAAPAPIPPTTSGENGSVTRSKLNLVYQYVHNNQVDIEALEVSLAAMGESLTNYIDEITSVQLALKQDSATAATSSQLNTLSNTLAQIIAQFTVPSNPDLPTTNILIDAPTYLVVSNGLVYAMTPVGDLVEITYYLPSSAVIEPTTNYPAGFAAFDFEASTTNVSASAPQIAEWTRQNQPGDTVALTAEELDSTTIFAFTDDGTDVFIGDILALDDRQCAVTLPDGLSSNSFYLAWPYNSEGFGDPVGINQTELWWIGFDQVSTGDVFYAYGRNLMLGDGGCSLYIAELDQG